MNTTFQPLEYDSYCHIYNRGINSCDLFDNEQNYELFLRKYFEYIESVAETFAWCLMKNHFHLLVKILPENEIKFIKTKENEPRSFNEKKKYNPTKQFSHVFNSYTKNYNVQNNRTGGLFETPFRRIKIEDDSYLKNLIYYIHHNPVKHGFTDEMYDYPWSSYLSIISVNPSKLKSEKIIGLFNSKSEFIEFHKNKYDDEEFKLLDMYK